MSEEGEGYCFEYQRRVEFHETDLAGIVHFSNFYRYMETAEHEFMRSLGHSIHQQMGEAEIGWPRVSATCDFRKPARNDDVLIIRLSIKEIRTRSVRYGFQFFIDVEEPPIATGSIAAVCVKFEDDSIAAVPIPDQIRADLEAAQKSASTKS
ncbi:MAG: thioesterase family protein [Roseibacillus sp.]|jgi:YbgC/YbaW family acyl-CoA thioester hydrolase